MIIEPLHQIQHEIGFVYISLTQHPELSSHEHPSAAVVLENGVPLPGPANALHEDIRQLGGGRYSFWYDSVYFSTSDNSNPRINGRSYAIAYEYPKWGRLTAVIQQRWTIATKLISRGMAYVREMRLSQVFWNVFYWLCFGWVLLRRRKD